MMSVEEYALDVNKSVEEILKKCAELNIDAKEKDDFLDYDAIDELDRILNDVEADEEIEEIVEDIAYKEKIDMDNSIAKQKLKKKAPIINQIKVNKKDLANKKKEMYKNKEKLKSNEEISDNIVLYTEYVLP